MEGFQSSLSKLIVPDLSTPVDAFHSYVIRNLQVLGSCWFPLPDAAPHCDWISGDTWLHMNLLGVWRKQRANICAWGQALLLKVLFHGWCSLCMLVSHREALNGEIHIMKILLDHQRAQADCVIDRARRCKEQKKKVHSDRRLFVARMVSDVAGAARSSDWKSFLQRSGDSGPTKRLPFLC